MYDNKKYGSPLVMMDAVSKAIFTINKNREDHVIVDPHYFFIEKDPQNYNSLINVICESNVQHKTVNTIEGDFNFHLPKIINHIKDRNPRGGGGSIFFLDQDGYSAVSVSTLDKIRRELPIRESYNIRCAILLF